VIKVFGAAVSCRPVVVRLGLLGPVRRLHEVVNVDVRTLLDPLVDTDALEPPDELLASHSSGQDQHTDDADVEEYFSDQLNGNEDPVRDRARELTAIDDLRE